MTSGRYIPPAVKRRMLKEAAESAGADEYNEVLQRESWENLKKQINGPVNKVNIANINDIVVELFKANLIRGRGLFCRSIMRAQSLSSSYTPVYAALVAVINTKLPIVGELLVSRLVLQFRRAFNRDDKSMCISSVMFLAHLTNQRIANEILAFQIVSLLLETPTDDSVEVAVSFMREVGAFLLESAPRVLNAVFDTFRSILHEADIDKRIQYMIEALFQIRRDGFKDSPIIPEGLDLVEEDDQIVHEIALDDDELDAQDGLNVFKYDEDYSENERKYSGIKAEILGESSNSSNAESGSESGSEGDSESGSDSEDEKDAPVVAPTSETPGIQKIHDLTETDLVNLRRTIYLSIMSSLSFEEATHKLLQIKIRPGEEQELCNMVIECCSQERTYKSFYGLIGERLCKLNRQWKNGFMLAFTACYENIHQYETGHLRNIAHFFSHQLATDALHWSVLRVVVLTEETTTSSSRIFLKILLQDLAEQLGLQALNERLKSTEPSISEALVGMFPSNAAKSIRFAINYYTSIGLGALTDEMREWLKTAPTAVADGESDDTSDSDTSSGSGSDSSSGSYTSSSISDSGSGSGSGSGSDSDSNSDSGRSARSSSRSSRSSVASKFSKSSKQSRSPKAKVDVSPRRDTSGSRSPKPTHGQNKDEVYRRQTSKPVASSDTVEKRKVRTPSYSPQPRASGDKNDLPSSRERKRDAPLLPSMTAIAVDQDQGLQRGMIGTAADIVETTEKIIVVDRALDYGSLLEEATEAADSMAIHYI
ncbi:pre-mRNA-splicing factor cwc22 [Coemansia sp. RSA 2703]|nr:pre-mRNA-splicing factor cwc22 [Coemansia sp. RSA 2703]